MTEIMTIQVEVGVRTAFQEYIDSVLTHKGMSEKTKTNYWCALKSFIHHVGELNIKELTFDHISLWKELQQEKGLRLSTITHNIIIMRNVVEFCKKRGYCTLSKEDIDTPKIPRPKPNWLEPQEVRAIINNCRCVRDKLLVSLLFSTGCRIGEIMNIDLTDIHDDYILIHGKGDKYRPVFFDATTKVFLDQYLESRTDTLPYLFTSFREKRLTISTAQFVLKQASSVVDKRVHPHVLRHSYATNASMAGMPITMLKEILGHDNITTTMMYIHSTLKDRQEAYHKYKVAY